MAPVRPRPGRVVQRGIVGAVASVRIDPGVDERVDGGDIAELGGVAQLEFAVRRCGCRGKRTRGGKQVCVDGLDVGCHVRRPWLMGDRSRLPCRRQIAADVQGDDWRLQTT